MGRRLLAAAVAVVSILGMKLYSKVSAHDDVRSRLVALCATDADCLAGVEKHYDACFESSYRMGGRRQSSQLDVEALVRCVNTESGTPYFAVAAGTK